MQLWIKSGNSRTGRSLNIGAIIPTISARNQKEEERQNQASQYQQFVAEKNRLEQAAEEKRKQARKANRKTKGAAEKSKSQSGGRLAHQKTIGSKEKALHNAAKSMEHRIDALGDVQAPEKTHAIRFRQSPALALHNS